MAKTILDKKLIKAGVDKSIVSDECLIELVKMAVGSAKFSKMGGKHFNNSFIDFLNADISIIFAYINNPDEFDNDYEDAFYKEIFERHNVPTKRTLEEVIENNRQMIYRLKNRLLLMLSVTPNDSEIIQMLNWLKEVGKDVNNAEILLKQKKSF